MEELLLRIVNHIKGEGPLSPRHLQAFIREYNQNLPKGSKIASKRGLLEIYLKIKRTQSTLWQELSLNSQQDKDVLKTLRMKPTRTASGVATITVITKPEVCSSNCLYCPCDVRMPKSYLFDEPACQRAERQFFDPYLQASIRLTMLQNMGHITDKVELIVLGGTWSDYPEAYRTWFIKELFRALNDDYDTRLVECEKRRQQYRDCGVTNVSDEIAQRTENYQSAVEKGDMSFNEAVIDLYKKNAQWKAVATFQTATFVELQAQHTINESAENRVVGLVVETQPDTITPKSVRHMRELGCTKVQIGVQSLHQDVLDANQRYVKVEKIAYAFELLRLYGFKIHAHFMANLYKATLEGDIEDYKKFVLDNAFQPDEIKLYPCALISGSQLVPYFERGLWRPYTEDELMKLLITNMLITPPFIRISRMIREFASHNIVDGNKKVNFRELVEAEAGRQGKRIQEIRSREVSLKRAEKSDFHMEIYSYETNVSSEKFIQWVNEDNIIAGFLRLSFPSQNYVSEHQSDLAIKLSEAMIREVHVYGSVAGLGATSQGAQHLGLGRQLIQKACELSRDAGYEKLNVISSVGTRNYYRSLGFYDNGLYQQIRV